MAPLDVWVSNKSRESPGCVASAARLAPPCAVGPTVNLTSPESKALGGKVLCGANSVLLFIPIKSSRARGCALPLFFFLCVRGPRSQPPGAWAWKLPDRQVGGGADTKPVWGTGPAWVGPRHSWVGAVGGKEGTETAVDES